MAKPRSRLETSEVQKVVFCARNLAASHDGWLHDQEHYGHRVNTLAWLGALEAAIDEMVSRETSKVEAILDGQTEEPPF